MAGTVAGHDVEGDGSAVRIAGADEAVKVSAPGT
jgi:hypothetical protein